MLTGSITALVTPMTLDGSIDYPSLQHLVERQVTSGTRGLIIAGSTGESHALTDQEHHEILSFVVNQVEKRVVIIANTGTSSLAQTIALTEDAQKAGATMALIMPPAYSRPTQEGLYAYYKAITEAVNLPIIIYNAPKRAGCDIPPETTKRLSLIPSIVGIKETAEQEGRIQTLLDLCDSTFGIYDGNDERAFDSLTRGTKGTMSVTSNILPREMATICETVLSGDIATAKAWNDKLMPLHDALFLEPNPIPVKWVLHKMGFIPAGIRLPLQPLNSEYHARLEQALAKAGLSIKY